MWNDSIQFHSEWQWFPWNMICLQNQSTALIRPYGVWYRYQRCWYLLIVNHITMIIKTNASDHSCNHCVCILLHCHHHHHQFLLPPKSKSLFFNSKYFTKCCYLYYPENRFHFLSRSSSWSWQLGEYTVYTSFGFSYNTHRRQQSVKYF